MPSFPKEPVRPFARQLSSEGIPDFSPEKTAILVVDMQYFDAHPDWGEGRTAKELGVSEYFDEYFEQIDEITPRIQKILRAARGKGVEVIFIRVAELTADSRDAGYKQIVRGLSVPCDSMEAKFLPGLEPEGDEIVINKSSSGVFPVTNIDRIFRNVDISTLVFCGTATGGCVESGVIDAADLGYQSYVIGDACADSTRSSNDLALRRMDGTVATISTTQELIDQIESAPKVDRFAKSGYKRSEEYRARASAVEDEAKGPYDLIFPPAIELDVDLEDTALVAIDFQRFACDPDTGIASSASSVSGDVVDAYYARVNDALENSARLMEACREVGLPTIHVRTCSRFPDGRELSPLLKDRGIPLSNDDVETEFMETMVPAPDEVVISKPGLNSFNGTGFDDILRHAGIKTLIICGTSFDGAVEATIRGATDRGYEAFVIPDACSASHAVLQDKLEDMESGIINVKQSDEMCQMIRENDKS